VTEHLRDVHVLEYPYTRTVGATMGRFFTALRERRIEGVRGSDGRVIVPPAEYDPFTAETLTDFVQVGDSGEVVSWAWRASRRAKQPLSGPGAWALIRLDGADTSMLHMVDTSGDLTAMSTGMRVKARWAENTEGDITDIVCFEPEDKR
jgi:uncharacterized protein